MREFKLRPLAKKSHGLGDCGFDMTNVLNDHHELGARALAEAVVAATERDPPLLHDDDGGNIYLTGWDDGYASAMLDMRDIIHRLVPPKDQASNKETDK